mgnify:CR=1 FL=1
MSRGLGDVYKRQIYRFAPFTVDTALLLTTHSTNERIPVGQMTQGVTFFKRYIRLMTAE